MIIEIVSLLFKLLYKTVPYDHARKEIAVNINPFPEGVLDNVTNCYESNKNENFSFENTCKNLEHIKTADFLILHTYQCSNCLYLNISFIDVFERKDKDGRITNAKNRMNTYFSINYLVKSKDVHIYGCSASNDRITGIYKKIAQELYTATI